MNATSELPQVRMVTIPGTENHGGYMALKLVLPWVCRKCGDKRGEPFKVTDWDGDRKMIVDAWRNPCGHIELYSEIRGDLQREGKL